MKPLLVAIPILALAPVASARDFVSGQVLAPGGAGLPGCNLDFFHSATGIEQTNVQNDGTGAGGFFLTTIPAGTYDILVWPPAALAILPKWVYGVVVAGTTNVGTIQLEPGVFLSGTVTDSVGVAAAGVDLDVRVAATGAAVPLQGDDTNLFGQFQVVVPATRIHVFFDPSAVAGPILAPRQILDLGVCASTNLGTVVLSPGFVLSASVFANGQPVWNCDLDVRPAGGEQKLFTPGDNTNSSGFVDLVVPSGTYDVEFGPPLSAKLVAKILANVTVSTNLSLGVVALVSGWYLSGTVTSAGGQAVAGVDLDVKVVPSGVEIPTPDDNTNALGQYQVVVPSGTYNLDFDPPALAPHGSTLVPNVVVSGDLVVNASLPPTACQAPSHYGSGIPGTGGATPTVVTNDFARIGSVDFRALVRNGRGGAPATLLLGAGSTSIPLFGGTLLVSPVPMILLYSLTLGGPAGVPCVGAGSVAFPIPADSVLVGSSVFFQAVVFDPTAVLAIAFTDGMQVVVCS